MAEINPQTKLGGQTYPFLKRYQDWRIETFSPDSPDSLGEIIGKTDMSLRTVKDKVSDIYVMNRDGSIKTPEQLLSELKLEVSLKKGPFVLSKRLSRIFRPYFVSSFLKKVDIVRDPQMDTKLWDGAGLISRKLLLRLARYVKVDNPSRKKQIINELKHAKRVEFTFVSDVGQEKGHAYVVEDLEHDAILPLDIKTEVRLTSGETFVGIVPVHSRDYMNLDVQSHVNLHPFFKQEDLEEWLKYEADMFLMGLEIGSMDEILKRIDEVQETSGWFVKEYFASGGESMWFAGIIRSIAMQHANKIIHTNREHFRLPVPGGRYYLFSASVGQRIVPRGQIEIDPSSASAYVSDEDYPEIARILGGADQDDALWVFPFVDYDGKKRVLIWRSPNQLGEYFLLEPSDKSYTIPWAYPSGYLVWPEADSRKLPPRIDTMKTVYEDRIHRVYAKEEPYSIAAMNRGIYQMVANAGGLGMTCNVLMVSKATTGTIPDVLPARLEEIIDASQKTGDDLSEVKSWVMDYARRLVVRHTEIPSILVHRIQNLVGEKLAETIKTTEGHWLDHIVDMTRNHLIDYQEQMHRLMNKAIPPTEVLQAGSEYVQLAASIRNDYTRFVDKQLSANGKLTEEDFDQMREIVEGHLSRYDEEMQEFVLAGMVNRIYLSHRTGQISDGILWLLGKKDGDVRLPGVADKTLSMLRRVGVLSMLVDSPQGVMTYSRRPLVTNGEHVKINAVWFTEALRKRHYQRQADVPKEEANELKELVRKAAETGRYNQKFRVRTNADGRKVVLEDSGEIFGFVQRGHEAKVGETIEIQTATADDGNLFAIVV